MVFITAGMGKGTGTGASPVVAEIAKELGILTVGVVTKPFNYEGSRKMRVADEGIENLITQVDSLIVVLNEKLFEVMDEDATLEDAFKRADDVLNNAVAGIAEIINVPGLVNVDFADVKTIMGEQGKAMMGIGEASGLDRARLAAEQAVSSPLLDGVDLHGARGVIVNITATRSLKLRETNEVINTIKQFCAEDATIIHGTVYEEGMEDSLRVTVVATGIGKLVRKPQLVQAARVKTGTDHTSARAPSMRTVRTSRPYSAIRVRKPMRGSTRWHRRAWNGWTFRHSCVARRTGLETGAEPGAGARSADGLAAGLPVNPSFRMLLQCRGIPRVSVCGNRMDGRVFPAVTVLFCSAARTDPSLHKARPDDHQAR